MRRKNLKFENLEGWTAGVREEMVKHGAVAFSQIHVKSVETTQLGCRPAEQSTNRTDFSAAEAVDLQYVWLKKGRLWMLWHVC